MCLIPLFFHEQKIACGKCPECLSAQRRDWIYRCEQEAQKRKFNYFFTLTFNENNLPPDEAGVWKIFTQFRKDFHKERGKFQYFVSMERGDEKGRLHLHMLAFSDFALPKDFIRKIWRYGFITRSSITPKRIRYAVSYMFSPDMFNKVKMYRSCNHFGGEPLRPYRIRTVKGRPEAVPLPRYYCKKFHDAGVWAKQYYDKLYHEIDFNVVYQSARERFLRLRSPYGKKRVSLTYEEYLYKFIESRVRSYARFDDSRDLIAFPGDSHYQGLNRCYTQLLRRVNSYIAVYGGRLSSNLNRYLTIDCSMSLREQGIRARIRALLNVKRWFPPPKPDKNKKLLLTLW